MKTKQQTEQDINKTESISHIDTLFVASAADYFGKQSGKMPQCFSTLYTFSSFIYKEFP